MAVSLRAKLKKHKRLIPFVIPAMLFALVFSYLPMLGIIIAFKIHKAGNYIIPKPKEYDEFKSLMMPYDKYPIFSMYGPEDE